MKESSTPNERKISLDPDGITYVDPEYQERMGIKPAPKPSKLKATLIWFRDHVLGYVITAIFILVATFYVSNWLEQSQKTDQTEKTQETQH